MMKKYVYLGIALAAMFAVILWPEVQGLSQPGKVALGVGLFAIIVWVTQALDDAQSGFCIVAFLALFGAATLGKALSGYATGGVWIVMLGMVMAAGMERSGISRRIALKMVGFAGKSPGMLYWMVALITLCMTFFIPSLGAKTLLLMPILAQMGAAFGAEKGQSSLVKGLVFVVTITGTMFCIGILTSHAANPITAGFLEKAGMPVSWAEWFVIGGPPAIVCGLLAVPLLRWMWPSEVTDITAGQAYVKGELDKLGKLSAIEIYTAIVFLATLALWATDKLHGINSTLVAIMTVIAIIAPGPQQVMTWKEAEKKVPWNIFIVYGAGLSMGAILMETGAAKWIAETFFYGFTNFDLKLQVIIFIWLMLALQVLFTGAGPKTTALTPVIIAYAVVTGIADDMIKPFVLLVGMNMLHQYLLPVSNLPNIIGLATEEITAKELIKTGAVMSIFGAAFMSVMVYTYWTWLGLFEHVPQ
jgi:anion transporter